MTTPTTVPVRLQLRADTAANWTSVNPILLANELGRETDTGKIKIGNGTSTWTSLAYQAWATLPVAVNAGGTGQTSYTNGQLLIGNTTGNTLTKATLTAGSGVAITNGTGSITVAASGIANTNIAADAEIAVSKLQDGTARQLLQTAANGTDVEWASNIDIPGTLDVTGNAVFDANLTVQGDLTVNGTETIINTQTLTVEDKNIELGKITSPTDVTADGGGITLKGTTDKTINWIDATDAWTLSEHVDLATGKEYRINGAQVLTGTALGSGVTSSSLTSVGTISSGTWQGTAVGTAYGGTGQTTYANGELLIGKTDGTLAKATLTAGTGVAVTNADGSITVAVDSTVVTTAQTGTVTSTMIADGTIVDADVNASAAIGLAKLATGALPTGITVESANIVDGTIVNADISASAGIVDTKLATIATAGKVSNSATTADSANTASAIVARDGSGNFTAGTITAALTGNASTATALETARTIGGVSFDGTANINLPGVNTAGNQDTTGNAATVTTNADLTGDVTSVGNATSIAAGVIVDADVNASAAIAGTKISPNFGSQNVVTTGTATAASLIPTGSSVPTNGVYLPAANSVAISTDGIGRLFVDASGNVFQGGTVTGFQTGPGGLLGKYLSVQSQDATTIQGIWLLNQDATFRRRASFAIDPANNTAGLYTAASTGGAPDIVFAPVNTERARIDSSGRLLVGTSTSIATAGGTAGLLQIHSATGTTHSISNWASSGSDPARLTLTKSQGGSVGTRGIVGSAAHVGFISFGGDDGTNFINAATISAFVDGTPGANDMPGRLVFSTTADGASSPTERMRITSAGVLQVADAGNIAVGTTTGTKIGTATTQKLGFYNATPVVQPTAVADATDAATAISQLNALLAHMRTLGLIAT